MGWLKAFFGGNSPDGAKEVVAFAFRQNLRRIGGRPCVGRRLDAAAHALRARYKAKGYDKPLEVVGLEAAPFAYLDDEDAEKALAEYVVMVEFGQETDWLRATFKRGLYEFLDYPAPEFAAAKISLYNLIPEAPEYFPWAPMLDEECLSWIWTAAKSAMDHLGLDTTDMNDDGP